MLTWQGLILDSANEGANVYNIVQNWRGNYACVWGGKQFEGGLNQTWNIKPRIGKYM